MAGINVWENNVIGSLNVWIPDKKEEFGLKRFCCWLLDVISWKEKKKRKQTMIEQQELQEQEQLQQRMDFVNQEIDAYIQKVVKDFQRQNEEIERQNTTCPNCQSNDVVDRILSWCIEWEDTTLTVCHCSDCSNEWLNNENEEGNATCSKCNSWSIVHRIIKNWYIKGWENEREIETVCHCNWCSNEWLKQEKKIDDIEYIIRISDQFIHRLHIIIEDCLYHKYEEDVDPNDSNKLNEKRVQNFRKIIKRYPGFEDLSIESLEYLRWLNLQRYMWSWNPYTYRIGREKVINVLKQLWFKYSFEKE